MTHTLKAWPEAFHAMWEGTKRFELRKDDRAFEVGDVLLLQEWDPATLKYTGAWIRVEITYILRPGVFPGLETGHVIMSILPLSKGQAMCIRGA